MHVTNVDNLLINKIIDLEAHNSLRFKIFLHMNLNIYNQTDVEFQQTVGISSATYFRLKKNLQEQLEPEKIQQQKKVKY